MKISHALLCWMPANADYPAYDKRCGPGTRDYDIGLRDHRGKLFVVPVSSALPNKYVPHLAEASIAYSMPNRAGAHDTRIPNPHPADAAHYAQVDERAHSPDPRVRQAYVIEVAKLMVERDGLDPVDRKSVV